MALENRLAPATFTWDGGSAASDLWSDAANWAGDVAPTAGSLLVFPAGAARLANTNNFAGGTVFESLVVANGYSLGGNGIALTDGATGMPTSAAASPSRAATSTATASTMSSPAPAPAVGQSLPFTRLPAH